MATELRWILLGLSALLLVGIWWWGMRRSRQSPGNAHLRETGTGPAILGPTIMSPSASGAVPGQRADDAESRDWGVPPFEPLSIRTADFDQEPAMDLAMSATADPLDVTLNMDYVEHELAAHPPRVVPGLADVPDAPDPEHPQAGADESPADEAPVHEAPAVEAPAAEAPASPAAAAAQPASPNTSERQRIVTVRVCALGDAQWAGADLLAALENQGLRFGRYKVFHRKHHDGSTLFCAASLVEPGTFDITRMPDDEFRGLTLFAVLPGQADAVEIIDALLGTAVDLADTLRGAVQDARGAPLSAQRAEALRAEVALFQQSLSAS